MNNDFKKFIEFYFENVSNAQIDIETGVKIFLTHVRANKTPATYKFYMVHLSYIETWILSKGIYYFNQVNNEILDQYVFYEKNTKHNTNNTINKRIGALKTCSQYLASIGSLQEPIKYEKLKIIKKDIDIIPDEVISEILNLICDYPVRNKLIIYLIITTGIRRTELCHILRRNIDIKNHRIYLEHTKTNSPRYIYTSELVENLLKNRLKESSSIYLLSNNNEPLSTSTIDSLFMRIKKGLTTDIVVSPHKFRHTFATNVLKNNGGNIEQVRLLLGHSDYSMTKRYLHLIESDLMEASIKFNPLANLKNK